MKKKMLAMAMSLLMIATAGCGGGGNAAPSEAGTSAEGGAQASGRVWKIVTDTAFKPFEYTDDNGSFVGIDVDIFEAISKDQGFEYEMQPLGWDASIAACKANQADGMIAAASITDERKELGWIFSDGYYDANQSMAVEASSSIDGFEDLSGKTVAAKRGSVSATYAESLAGQYKFTVTYFEDSPAMYRAVADGQVVAVFDDTPVMAASIKDTGIAMKLVDGTGNEPAAYGFAIFNTKNQELLDMFNKGLENIRSNGVYDEILKKYLGE